jgi:hypothetical protein
MKTISHWANVCAERMTLSATENPRCVIAFTKGGALFRSNRGPHRHPALSPWSPNS